MNILIVDGNEKKASNKYVEMGMPTQFEVYEKVLKNLVPKDCNMTIVHPASSNDYLSKGISLEDFNGIVWTGSLLNIYDLGAPIMRQIELAKELFKNKNKIFGSCWGLQVLATAAGGTVRKNPKGLEAVIANDIVINAKGIEHPMYKNKPKVFDSFCWHYDEVESLPFGAKVLSSNDKSSIQSLVFSRNKSDVWAVQYHPEFDSKWISGLMKQRELLLLKEGIYLDSKEFNKVCTFLSSFNELKNKGNQLSISETILNSKIHTLELANWCEHLMNDI